MRLALPIVSMVNRLRDTSPSSAIQRHTAGDRRRFERPSLPFIHVWVVMPMSRTRQSFAAKQRVSCRITRAELALCLPERALYLTSGTPIAPMRSKEPPGHTIVAAPHQEFSRLARIDPGQCYGDTKLLTFARQLTARR